MITAWSANGKRDAGAGDGRRADTDPGGLKLTGCQQATPPIDNRLCEIVGIASEKRRSVREHPRTPSPSAGHKIVAA